MFFQVDDELKRIRNPRLLTARQRALLEKQGPREADEELGPTGGGDIQDRDVTAQDLQSLDHSIVIPPEPLLALPSGLAVLLLHNKRLLPPGLLYCYNITIKCFFLVCWTVTLLMTDSWSGCTVTRLMTYSWSAVLLYDYN